MSRYLRIRTRVDRVFAAVGLVLAGPVVAVLGLRIRRHDGGPAFVAVPRIGEGGRPFRMWKLRSMRVATVDGTAGGSSLTSGDDDDRITAVGRTLRRFHLDELPQLWNVVRGDMALLGPRPEAPDLVSLDDPRWQTVLRARPGIAGPTQLVVGDWESALISADPSGDVYRDTVLPVKLAIDEEYVCTAGLMLDLEVLMTLVARVCGRAWSPLSRTHGHRLRDAMRVLVAEPHAGGSAVAAGDFAWVRSEI